MGSAFHPKVKTCWNHHVGCVWSEKVGHPKIPWRIILLSVSVLELPCRGYTWGILNFWTTPHGIYLDCIQSNIQNIRMNILWGTYNYYGQISNNDQPSTSINTPQRNQQKGPFCRISRKIHSLGRFLAIHMAFFMPHPFYNGHFPLIHPRHGGGVPGVMGIGVLAWSGSQRMWQRWTKIQL